MIPRRTAATGGVRRLVESYGDGPLQRGEWWLPAGEGSLPTVVLVHGGFWRPTYDRTLEDALAADLSVRGYLCWNTDYSAADRPWPATLTDIATSYDHLVTGQFADRVDRARVAVVGHSAGGQLALWLASRHQLPVGAPGAPMATHVRPQLCVAQAPVASLAQGASDGLGGGAVDRFVGGTPEQVPERYEAADPLALLPTGVRTRLVHGTRDDTVPISQSTSYVAAAVDAGDDAVLVTYDGGHFEHLDPSTEAVQLLRDALSDLG